MKRGGVLTCRLGTFGYVGSAVAISAVIDVDQVDDVQIAWLWLMFNTQGCLNSVPEVRVMLVLWRNNNRLCFQRVEFLSGRFFCAFSRGQVVRDLFEGNLVALGHRLEHQDLILTIANMTVLIHANFRIFEANARIHKFCFWADSRERFLTRRFVNCEQSHFRG